MPRLALIFGVTAGVAAALFFLVFRSGSEQQSLLYAGLAPGDAAQVAQQLDQAGIRYSMDGSSIYVGRDEVSQARILVANESALGSGTVGYEIFDESDALGATQFVQNVNARRATEGELARTIATIHGVTAARVHLVLPERRLFERDASEPTATVVVGLTDPALAGGHARTIRNLVATAVPGLNPSRVTVVDEEGRTLANGAGEQEEMSGALLEDRRAGVEERLRRKVLDALTPIVGLDGARVQVAADVDLTRVSTSAETFDPDGQVVRSSSLMEETSSDRETEESDAVSVSANLPGGEDDIGAGAGSASDSNRIQEVYNYEISRTTTTEVREAGEVQRLSVAVTVDHARTVADDGTVSWRPRTEDELVQIAAVARAAVGFNAARGDVVEVTNLQFDRILTGEGVAAPGPLAFTRNDILRFAEIAVMLIVGLALTLLVARPLAKGLASPAPALAMAGGPAQALPAGQAPARVGQGGDAGALPAPERRSGEGGGEDDEEEAVNIGQVDGKVKASVIRRISEVVDDHPEESIAILRTWMNER